MGKFIPRLLIWSVLIFAGSHINRLDLGYISSLCGAWGCLAPTSSLLGMHAIWMVCVVPIFWLPFSRRAIAFGLLGYGIIGVSIRFGALWHRYYDAIDTVADFAKLLGFSIFGGVNSPASAGLLLGFVMVIATRVWQPARPTFDKFEFDAQSATE